MKYRLYPLANKLSRYFHPTPELSSLAYDIQVLSQEEVVDFPRVIMDPNDWDLITDYTDNNHMLIEKSRVLGGARRQSQTVRYQFKDVLASPAGFHVFGGTYSGLFGHYLQPIYKKIPEYDAGLYASTYVTSKFFGHWLTDGLATCLLRSTDELPYLWHTAAWTHSARYKQIFDVKTIDHDLAYFKEISFIDDIGMTQNRRDRLKLMNSKIRQFFKNTSNSNMVYLRRGKTGSPRPIVNEDQLVERLQKQGFSIVDVSQPLHEVLNKCAGANLTISMEGSHCSHLILSASPGAKHIIINQSDRFNNVFAEYMPALSAQMATVVAQKQETGYIVNIDSLLRMISRLHDL